MSPADRFTHCLAEILKYEGGFSDNLLDKGGPTYRGVTLKAMSAWRGRTCSVDELKALTDAVIAEFYEDNYWHLISGDDLPVGIDLMLFDCAVNQGPSVAVRLLQTALGCKPDGDAGPLTMTMLAIAEPVDVVDRVKSLRESRYRANSQFETFGKGWLSRLAQCWGTARSWALAADQNQGA